MTTTSSLPHSCARCGKEYPIDVLVCPTCKEIIPTQKKRRGAPSWVIALLIIAILALFAYAIVLLRRIEVWHQF